ncbi:unnamed protein product [Closterium sp. NIES-54]
MAELNVATLTQEQLDRLMRQLEESALEIATLTAERDSARQQSIVNAPAPTHSDEPIVISSGTPTQNDSVGHRSGVASEGAAHSMPGMERNRVTPSPREPREARQHVEFAATSGEYAITAPMPLKPQRPPCFDPSQRGGPTVQSWVFTMNVFFDANYVESDASKIRYAVSLLRGLAMDWWRVIVTSPRAYEPPSQEDGPTGPVVTGVHSARQPSTARGMRGAQGFRRVLSRSRLRFQRVKNYALGGSSDRFKTTRADFSHYASKSAICTKRSG